MLLPVALLAFTSCGKDETKKDDGGASETLQDYRVVYSAKGGSVALSNAESLVKAIRTVTGVSLKTSDDSGSGTACEILLGNVNRTETSQAAARISGNGYAIKNSEKKLVIYGSDDNYEAIALRKFETSVLKNVALAGSGFLKIESVPETIVSGDKRSINLEYVVQNNFNITASLASVCTCPKEGTVYVAQGACTDGSYVYFVNRNSSDNLSIVYKYDATTFKQVAKTDGFDGGHSNDMTYDSKNKRIVCLSGGTSSDLAKVVSFIDTETMKVTSPVAIPTGLTAVTYNETQNTYAGRNGQNLYLMDKGFNIMKNGKRSDGSSLTSQGLGSDDTYLYFPMSGTTSNELLVYDWNLNYVRTITLDTTLESESLFKLGDEYYINFYRSGNGAELCRLDIDTITYVPSV